MRPCDRVQLSPAGKQALGTDKVFRGLVVQLDDNSVEVLCDEDDGARWWPIDFWEPFQDVGKPP